MTVFICSECKFGNYYHTFDRYIFCRLQNKYIREVIETCPDFERIENRNV